MSERTCGIYRFLRRAAAYDILQAVIRPTWKYREFVERYVRPYKGMRLLDVGCGTATILSYLPCVEYIGVDVNANYIRRAAKRFGNRGTFIVSDGSGCLGVPDKSVDVVLALGVLHHVNDEVAKNILTECARVLAPGGRFVSHDPVVDVDCSFGARLFVRLDRGKHVRARADLLALVGMQFAEVESLMVSDSLRIPFHEIILECRAGSDDLPGVSQPTCDEACSA